MNRRPTSSGSMRLLLTTALLALSAVAAASERLYSVELIVFSREAPSFEEVWPDDIALHYPPHARPLLPRQSAQPTAEQSTQPSAPEASLQASSSQQPPSPTEDAAPTPTIEESAAPTPPLLQSLERDDLNLTGVANALSRRSEYRVLFHERWIQPAQVDGRAVPIVVSGGKQYGEHHELGGFVRLQVGRLLHLQAHLWLAEFASTAASQPTDDQIGSTGQTWSNSPRDDRFAAPAQPATGIFLPRPPALPEAVDMQSLLGEEEPVATDDWSPTVTPEPAPLPQQVVVLEERRRVKFGELHYIDHPRLGAIVQVTAIDPDEPAQ